MKCESCGLEKEELVEAIYGSKIKLICKQCAFFDEVPIIRKPTFEQLNKANKSRTSGEVIKKFTRTLGPDSSVAVKNLSKIQFPEKQKEPENLMENFSWYIKISRRRKKLSEKQAAELSSLPLEVYKNAERGALPKDYMPVILNIEKALEVELIKRQGVKKPKYQELGHLESEEHEKAIQEQFDNGFNFSDKNKLEEVRIKDLKKVKAKDEDEDNYLEIIDNGEEE